MARPFFRAESFGVARGVVIALLCTVVLSALHLAGAFDSLDLKLTDWRYRIRGEREASDSIALIEISDATIEAYGRWPLSRDTYALLINALADAGARAVGFDLLFLGDDLYDKRFDALLAHMTAANENVVHSVTFVPFAASPTAIESPSPEILEVLRQHAIHLEEDAPLFDATHITIPFDELLHSANTLGHALVAVDRDGVIRRLPTFVRYQGHLYPCLALAVVGIYNGYGSVSGVEAVSRGLNVRWSDARSLFIPVDRQGATSIDFAGDRDAFARRYSMLEVLQWCTAGEYARLQKAFDGRIVLVGSTAVGQVATDVGSTPFSTTTPLLLVHANAVDALLSQRFLVRPSSAVYLLVLAGLSIVLGCLLASLSLPWAISTVALFLLGFAGVDLAFFAARGVDLPPTLALLLAPITYTAIGTYQYVFLQRKARERQKELEIAREIQRRLLPSSPPDVPELDVFGVNIPAQEVGGDYYDWIPVGEDSLVVTLGDVSGKGVAAALLMSHLRASLHAETHEGVSARSVAGAMNISLLRATEPERFATLFLAGISRKANQLHFCNAGHNPPLLVHGGQVDELPATGVPLGVFEGVEYTEQQREFGPGDLLIIYSDGITECPWKDKMYEDERLRNLVRQLAGRSLSSSQIAQAILDDVRSFCRGQPYADDVTLVVVRRL
ncbi:MAG: CHASE2 domain-containing protein [Candidatus Eiseniibacteriota bacterium]|nr:MAG: CHASE2 domain-containing protein [Candidatus Eisenbacteria bacterium]